MSDFNPYKLEEVVPGQKDVMHGGISPLAVYSVSLQNDGGQVYRDYNCYYICTKGAGFSIEVDGKLPIGKFGEEELRCKLEGRIFIESSIRSVLELSPALKKECEYDWELVRQTNGWYLVATKPGERGKVIRSWGDKETIRPLGTIMHWEQFGTYRFTDLNDAARTELCAGLKEELKCEDWPAPGESISVEYDGEHVTITHEDHINIINENFFETGLEED